MVIELGWGNCLQQSRAVPSKGQHPGVAKRQSPAHRSPAMVGPPSETPCRPGGKRWLRLPDTPVNSIGKLMGFDC